MTTAPRLIPLLLLQDGRALRAVGFSDWRPLGSAYSAAERLLSWQPDEFLLLNRNGPGRQDDFVDLVAHLRKQAALPLAAGGGIDSIDRAAALFRAGADRVALNAAALRRPDLITEVADRWGRQAVIVVLVCRQSAPGRPWRVDRKTSDGDLQDSGYQALDWAEQAAAAGAGEVLAIDRDRDGTGLGLPLQLIETLAEGLTVPVMAAGGVATPADVADGFASGAAAVAVGNALHYSELSYRAFRNQPSPAGAGERRSVA